MRRIRQSDLALNKPLPWPLYDADGHLLLREGYVLSIPRHIDALLARGAVRCRMDRDTAWLSVSSLF